MPFSPATPPKIPSTLGKILLEVGQDAAGNPVVGKVFVQVLNAAGTEYEKRGGTLATQLAAPVLAKVQDAVNAIRTQAQAQIL